MGAFQEERQVLATTPFTKYSHVVERTERIPFYVEQAVRTAWYGRPGGDLPRHARRRHPRAGRRGRRARRGDDRRRRRAARPPTADVEAAIAALRTAERPLVIVGKGMAWSRAEDEVRAFIEHDQLPFLNSPMGKGVMPDDHPLSVGAARSHALREADLVVLLGARLNWIMHFGMPPRFDPDVRVIQLDISAEQLSTNVPTEVGLVGDGKAVMAQLNEALARRAVAVPGRHALARRSIAAKIEANRGSIEAMAADDSAPMNYYRVFRDIRRRSRATRSSSARARTRWTSGAPSSTTTSRAPASTPAATARWASASGSPSRPRWSSRDRPVVSVSGDSAFGFSGMELETICRYNLPITTIVLNNGGIGGGFEDWPADQPLPPSALSRTARYEKVIEAFGGQGYYVEDPADLRPTLDKAISSGKPSVVHVLIAAHADRKPQEFHWKT